jgi:hypothetical protein
MAPSGAVLERKEQSVKSNQVDDRKMMSRCVAVQPVMVQLCMINKER